MDGPKSFGQALHQAGELLRGLTPSQRAWLAGGAVVLGITLWLFAGLIDKPKYATLYSGLKPADAQALGGRLAAKNISYEISPDGTSLSVPADQLDASRLETASQGLPRNARLGFELFDTPNWAGSDFTEKVNYQRALEGELERTLQTLSEVEAVRVHLVLPSESLYSEQASEAKAAVILKTRGGRLSEQAQLAIPQLVASAVERLRPENVTVVDADSNTPLLIPVAREKWQATIWMRNWPRRWSTRWNRWSAQSTYGQVCMWSMTPAAVKTPKSSMIRRPPRHFPNRSR